MLKEAVYHQPYGNYAYPIADDKLFIQLRAKKGDLKKVHVVYDERFRDWDSSSPRFTLKLDRYSSDEFFDYFRAEMQFSKKRFKYYFLLDDGTEQFYYSSYGFAKDVIDYNGCFQYTYICEKDYFDIPSWVKDAVFYQIFPDRFCNGNSNINPDNLTDWGEMPKWCSFYGGDLAGIIQKLDYLGELGITAIYLTPVFKSSTNHKYNTIDYMEIDPEFGDIDTCKELVNQAHQRGIKIIFDGVFNHTSDEFFAFQDIIEKGEDSKYKDWYYIYDFPVKKAPSLTREIANEVIEKLLQPDPISLDGLKEEIVVQLQIESKEDRDYVLGLVDYLIEQSNKGEDISKLDSHELWKRAAEVDELAKIIYPNYETFANGVWKMPKLKTANPEVREYLLEVARYWIEDIGIDGWRLDVADEVDHYFWREFRKVVKEANPEAYIVGEVWNDATPWLGGEEFDGVMNYLFATSVWDFFCRRKINVNTFEDRLSKVRTLYKLPAQLASLNLVDSHDTERVLTISDGDKERQRLAVAFQMTYIGAPMVYYGDELAMEGGSDPDCRRTMIWDEKKQDREMFDWYKNLIVIRKDNPALRTGDFTLIKKDAINNIYAFTRKKGNNQLLIIFNNSNLVTQLEFDLEELNIDTSLFIELLSNKEYQVEDNKIKINLEGYSVAILKVDNNE
ncbi:hypothetical protein U472_01555 [Orenia metallireducens]|uniref:Glycosyl hydrolase family 13 catalytic domain-containing protein n=1 Tax=Orenia metallireducens TaxID=1413210 RepID=A0A1C0AC17_9FIRM|nr:alpha-glycosidase [Orenia metallireducens]OCL27915.1 hypothetical protein U472_01555 [Orenia metallireducens]